MITKNVQNALNSLTKPEAGKNKTDVNAFKMGPREVTLAEFVRRYGFYTSADKHQELFDQTKAWLKELPPAVCKKHGETMSVNMEVSLTSHGVYEFVIRSEEVGPHRDHAQYNVCSQCRSEGWDRKRHDAAMRNGIPPRLVDARLSDLEYSSEESKKCLAICEAYQKDPHGFLLLLGGPGIGKTHIATAILRHFADGFFITQSNLLAAHRATYGDDRAPDVRKKCMNARLLVLDEVGVSVGGKDEMPLIYDIVSGRYDALRPTIITSNLADNELRQGLGERLIDRIEHAAFSIVRFNEPSRRAACNGKYLEQQIPIPNDDSWKESL